MFCWLLGRAAASIVSVRRWRWHHRLLTTVLACLVAPLLFHGWYIAFGGNFHTVVPGAVYRSAQPSKAELQKLVSVYGIRTVINLRGDNTDVWYLDEHDMGRTLGVQIVDVGRWAKQPPS